MGIYDRDYARQPPPSTLKSVPNRVRMLSVNTWLILLCVAVYMVDGFIPSRVVEMGVDWQIEEASEYDPSVFKYGPPSEVLDEQGRRHVNQRGESLFYQQPVIVDVGGKDVLAGVKHLRRMKLMESYMHFSTQKGFLNIEFWRLIGFQFIHASFTHLLFNMVGLFFFGPLAERYLGGKRYLAFYLLCGIFGALMYVLLNLGGGVASDIVGTTVRIPGLLFNDTNTPLVGASAGVFGVIMAGAYLAPTAVVLVFFVIPVRLGIFAYILVAMAIFSVLSNGNNAGGEAGHLGGAIAGFYFIRHPRHLHGFFDFLGWVDPTSHHYRGPRRKGGKPAPGRRKGGKPAPGGGGLPRDAATRDVDRILDKISTSGLHSLTDQEKRILKEASQR